MGLVFGKGVFQKGEYKSVSPEYVAWRGMLRRCYDPTDQAARTTYHGCTVSADFLVFQKFAKWVREQPGGGQQGWQLDKDLLVPGNKVYSAETCVFLPAALNKSIAVSKRGAWPVGVEKHGPSFRAYWEIEGVRQRVGAFKTPEEAYEAYKVGKPRALRLAAEKYKPQIDARAYQALLDYEVEGRNEWV